MRSKLSYSFIKGDNIYLLVVSHNLAIKKTLILIISLYHCRPIKKLITYKLRQCDSQLALETFRIHTIKWARNLENEGVSPKSGHLQHLLEFLQLFLPFFSTSIKMFCLGFSWKHLHFTLKHSNKFTHDQIVMCTDNFIAEAIELE